MRTINIPVGIIAFLAATFCFLVYMRTLGCAFVWLDDPMYVLDNQAIRSLDSNMIHWAFTNVHASFWIPLTWISFAIDYHFWQLNPFGYHLTNSVLHSLNVFLIVFIANFLNKAIAVHADDLLPDMSVSNALILLSSALFFGIHPLRVESVAWVTERKDVLNGFFCFGSILFYLKYVAEKGIQVRASSVWMNYGASFILFGCSMLVKPVSVIMPLMLMMLDWYPLQRMKPGRIKGVLLEKLPFILLAISVAISTIMIAKHQGILFSTKDLPWIIRCVIAGNALFEYCRLTLYPFGIVPFYLLEQAIPASYILKTLVIVAFTGIVLWNWRSRPWLTAGWLLFVLPLLPVLGFLQNGDQALAARFTYLGSAIPWILVVSIGYRQALAYSGSATGIVRALPVTITVTALLFYAVLTIRLIPAWDNTGTLWSRVIEYKPLGRAYQERGLYYYEVGNNAAAAKDLTAAIGIARANNVLGYNLVAHRAIVLFSLGDYQQAINDFTEAIGMFPSASYYYHRGLALRAMGRTTEAEEDFHRAGPDPGPIVWFE